MQESRRERNIRYSLVSFFLVITFIGFTWNSRTDSIHSLDKQSLQVLVLSEGNKDENPTVVVARENEAENYLIIYEVDTQDRFRFLVKEQMIVNGTVSALKKQNSKENGFWALINGDWTFYNSSMAKKSVHFQGEDGLNGSDVPFEMINDEVSLINEEVSFSNVNMEKLQSIHLLDENQAAWLIVYEQKFEVAKK
ncbi:hypothetical protein WAK64_00015 [Bacillus spongiae]|uniref:LPS export ABC transporter periplasmic protein LptC n=1 Tax=Bacillus spongiae TaxID=2683610 RepID=A0ABU8H842_9BACI